MLKVGAVGANLPSNLWSSHLYGNGIFVCRWLGQAKRPRLSRDRRGVLLYILCAILDVCGNAMHYMSASVGIFPALQGSTRGLSLVAYFWAF